jgi:hypothetical protein
VWRRLRRRTLAPRRPLLYEGQYALAFVTILVLVVSVYLAIRAAL